MALFIQASYKYYKPVTPEVYELETVHWRPYKQKYEMVFIFLILR